MIMCCKQSQHCVNFGEFDECFGEFLKPESCSHFAKKEETIEKRIIPQWLKEVIDWHIKNDQRAPWISEESRLLGDEGRCRIAVAVLKWVLDQEEKE